MKNLKLAQMREIESVFRGSAHDFLSLKLNIIEPTTTAPKSISHPAANINYWAAGALIVATTAMVALMLTLP